MNERKSTNIRNVIAALLIGYFLFLTYRAVMSNYQTNLKIASLREELDLLGQEEQYLEGLNTYYSTDTYKELEARRKLGMKKPGENVAYIPIDQKIIDEQNAQINAAPKSKSTIKTQETNQDMDNPQKWLEFVLRI